MQVCHTCSRCSVFVYLTCRLGKDCVLPKPLNIRQVDALLSFIKKMGTKTTKGVKVDGEKVVLHLPPQFIKNEQDRRRT